MIAAARGHGDVGTQARWRAVWSFRLGLLALFLAVLLARVVYVSLYAEDLPIGDEWDAIGERTLRSWVNGTWDARDFFERHNEHRIAFTRAVLLVLFAFNDSEWDNLVAAYVNAGIGAGTYLLLYVLLCWHEPDWRLRFATLGCTAAVAILPFGWENMLVGLQSAFYFLILAALAATGAAAYAAMSVATLSILVLLGVASLITLGSGALAAPAVAAVIAMRYWRDRRNARLAFTGILCMALVFALGVAAILEVARSPAVKAIEFEESLRTALAFLMWPLQRFGAREWPVSLCVAYVTLLWSPALAWLLRFVRTREATDSELFAAGVLAWVALQALAISYARGGFASRYADISSIALLANFWFAFRLLPQPRKSPIAAVAHRAIALSFMAVALWGLLVRTPADLNQMRATHQLTLAQKENVGLYLRTGDFNFLLQPWMGIPYRKPNRLRRHLDDAPIRAMLPASIRPSADSQPSGPTATASPRPVDTNPMKRASAPDQREQGRLSAGAHAIQGALRTLLSDSQTTMVAPTAIDAGSLDAARANPNTCALETIDAAAPTASTNVPYGSALRMSGWVIASDLKAPARFKLVLKGAKVYAFDASTGVPRPDLADAFRSSGAADAGFSAVARLDNVAAGAYRILALAPGLDGITLCDTQRRLVVNNSAVAFDPAALNAARHTRDICVLETVDGTAPPDSTSVVTGHTVGLAGWIVASDGVAPGEFKLVLQGPTASEISAAAGLPRPDVSRALGSGAAATAGFSAHVGLGNVPNGTYRMFALVPGQLHNELCDLRRSIVVRR